MLTNLAKSENALQKAPLLDDFHGTRGVCPRPGSWPAAESTAIARQELAAAEGPEYFAFSKIGIRLPV